MSGYVEAGYVVVLGTLGIYGVALAARERAARRRLGTASSIVSTGTSAKADSPAQAGEAAAVEHRAVDGSEPGPVQ
ncbi:MAG: hypothetical protein ACLQCU_05365 [Acidimicrobiales bacterium]